jgi:hypothetical protein
MWHFIHFIVRPVEALLGLFCLLTAIVLYPDEEGKIQSKFEDFWIRVDDYQQLALSRHAAFMRHVATVESRFLDHLFGHKLFSSRAVGVSISLSLATLSISMSYDSGRISYNPWAMGLFICSLLLGGVGLFVRRPFVFVSIIVVSALGFGVWWTARASNGSAEAYLLGAAIGVVVVFFCAVGFACDIAFVAVTRQLLRLTRGMNKSINIVMVVVVNLFLAGFLISPYLAEWIPREHIDRLSRPSSESLGYEVLRLVSLTNIFDVVLALLFVVLAAILIVHRAVWPLLTRTLFKMTDIGTKGRRAILTAVGMALLSASFFHEKIPDLLKEVIKAFGG